MIPQELYHHAGAVVLATVYKIQNLLDTAYRNTGYRIRD
jgi:hypothetical protein